MRIDERIAGKVKALRALEEARTRNDGSTEWIERDAKLRAARERVHGDTLALQAKRDEMREAYRAAVVDSGLIPCDVPWCHRQASHKWTRTPKEIKASRTKVKGCVQEMTPESIRCQVHVPDWRTGQYARLVQGARVERVA